MNIKEAKEYIKDCVRIYLKKDEDGAYRIPVVRKRPVFLLGAPGIGKTAVMEQIAQELGIALVSYSMTHHTRQSALGLPVIRHREFDGKAYDISEYTMSEIIASVYETMEESGIREGILFLDEINCVSETLAPSMLQFLQYKVFGRHQVPEGWIVVTAGNPPEYNKSVREFDVVTLDRLKVLEVEADYKTWKEYAVAKRIHGAVLNYLDLKKAHFYRIEAVAKGKTYVTARGWEDLSEILLLYEEEGLPVKEELIGQYIRNENIAKDFAAYYDLYQKYRQDYRVDEILTGCGIEQAVKRVKDAAFDERLSLLGMLLDRVQDGMKDVVETADYLTDLFSCLKAVCAFAEKQETDNARDLPGLTADMLKNQAKGRKKQIDSLKKANALSAACEKEKKRVISFLERAGEELCLKEKKTADSITGFLKGRFQDSTEKMKQKTEKVQKQLHFLFVFAKTAFAEGNEMLILVTELTINDYSARFIGMFGSEDYQTYNEILMLSERSYDLQKEIAKLEL